MVAGQAAYVCMKTSRDLCMTEKIVDRARWLG
jgi:hypothetical protein